VSVAKASAVGFVGGVLLYAAADVAGELTTYLELRRCVGMLVA
jgi:hypothetical protein